MTGMTAEFFAPLVEMALRVAARCHREQTRKLSDLPYISHPAAVALILLKAGFDDDQVLAAALLHDVVEDTGYSREALAAEFPPPVVDYVMAISERKLDAAGQKRPWHDRKVEHIAQLKQAALPVRAIALADKLHNLSSILFDFERDGAKVWEKFFAPREKLLLHYRALVDAVDHGEPELNTLARACRELIQRLENAVPME
jgi:(p)ppGpp synthase/HD superfamily hydrolase